jgi:hypothetical protein
MAFKMKGHTLPGIKQRVEESPVKQKTIKELDNKAAINIEPPHIYKPITKEEAEAFKKTPDKKTPDKKTLKPGAPMMGSSPILKNDIYKTYIDENGDEKTENLGTGSFGDAKADQVRQQNKLSTRDALINQKNEIEKKSGKTFDVKTEEGKNKFNKEMTDDEWREQLNIIQGGHDPAKLTYTGTDAEKILSLSPKDRETWEKDNPHATVEGSGGIPTSTQEMNKKVKRSKEIVKK